MLTPEGTVKANVGTWSKIWKQIPNYDPTITDSSYRLRRNYEKYLLDFENRNNSSSSSEDSLLFAEAADRVIAGGDTAIMTRQRAQLIRETLAASLSASAGSAASQSARERCTRGHSWDDSSEADHDSIDESSVSLNPPSVSSTRKAVERPTPPPPPQLRPHHGEAVVPQPAPALFIPASAPQGINDVLILNMGYLYPAPPYVTHDSIWPIGFRSRRAMYSIRNKGALTIYECSISDSPHGPLFMATPSDDPVRNTAPPWSS